MKEDYLIGWYKDVEKDPILIKIKKDKYYLEKLLDGEFTSYPYDDYLILYKKDSDRLEANIYIDVFSKIGLSIRGKIFVISKDENNNFISLNVGQSKRCKKFLIMESFGNKHYDKKGRYILDKRMYTNENIKDITSPQKINFETSRDLYDDNSGNNKNNNLQHVMVNEDTNRKTFTNKQLVPSAPPEIKLSDNETLQVLDTILHVIHNQVQRLKEKSSNENK